MYICRILLIAIIGLWFFGTSLADFDLKITDISLSNLWDTVALNSNPLINITIKNIWPDIVNNSDTIGEWFISCIENTSQNPIFNSSAMSTFIVNPDTTMVAGNLSLKDTLTMTQRTVNITCFVNKNWSYNGSFEWEEQPENFGNNTAGFSFNVDKLWRFDSSMNRAIKPIRQHLDAAEPTSTLWWWDSIKNFIFNKITDIITPIIIMIWILMGIIWAYKLFLSTNAEETTKGIKLIIYWVIWIMIMLSARYIWNIIFQDLFQSWNITWLTWVDLAMQIYEKIAYPFIKITIYLALWVLFVILAWKAFSFIANEDWLAQKKAWAMIGLMNESAQTLGEIWSWILADKSIPILYTVINRVMWLTSLVVLVIILVQTFEILMNPDKADNRQRIWKSILYIFIGILIIWAGYLITNFVIIN